MSYSSILLDCIFIPIFTENDLRDDVYVFCNENKSFTNKKCGMLISRFHLLHRITLPLPNYAGCIRLNLGVKWIKVAYRYEKRLEIIYDCSRKIWYSDINSVRAAFDCDMSFHMVKHGDIQSICGDFRHTTTTSIGICSRFSHLMQQNGFSLVI